MPHSSILSARARPVKNGRTKFQSLVCNNANAAVCWVPPAGIISDRLCFLRRTTETFTSGLLSLRRCSTIRSSSSRDCRAFVC